MIINPSNVLNVVVKDLQKKWLDGYVLNVLLFIGDNMTDRVISLLVTLDKEYRADDIQVIIDAIKMVKAVSDVTSNVFSTREQMNHYAFEKNFKHKLIRELMSKIENE